MGLSYPATFGDCVARFGDEVTARAAEYVPVKGKLPWIRGQLGKEAADLDAALADPTVPPLVIAKTLRKRGLPISTTAVRGWCQMARE